MTIWRLVFRELLYRKLNLALAVVSVLVAVGCLVGAMTLLRAHDVRTEQIIAAKQAQMQEQMRLLEDDYRKITKKLGFNVLILPRDQNLADLYADDFASKYMPEEYVTRLANSRIMTINHLLPTLQQKLQWPERRRTIILTGTRGEVPILLRDPKKPLLVAVAPGSMVVGYELHRSLGLSVGDKVTLLGEGFTVSKCHGERGNKDDITVWIDLAQAQRLLDKEGKINAILALSCTCSGAALGGIREDISCVLPDTQVIEFASKAVARAEARARASVAARQALAGEKAGRAELRRQREDFAAVLVPLVMVGCVVWIGLLAFGNVRDRAFEIGILRALGLQSRRVLLVFLARAALVGLCGAGLGYPAGFIVGVLWGEGPAAYSALFDPVMLLVVVLAAPLLAGLASWVPAVVATRQDPAAILREE